MTFAGSGASMMAAAAPPDTIGQFNLQLMPWNERVKAEEIFQNIRDRVADISGLEVQIAAQENGPPAGKAINLASRARSTPISRRSSASCATSSRTTSATPSTSRTAVPRPASTGK